MNLFGGVAKKPPTFKVLLHFIKAKIRVFSGIFFSKTIEYFAFYFFYSKNTVCKLTKKIFIYDS